MPDTYTDTDTTTRFLVEFIAEARFTVEVEAESSEDAEQMVQDEMFMYEDLDRIVAVNHVEHVEEVE